MQTHRNSQQVRELRERATAVSAADRMDARILMAYMEMEKEAEEANEAALPHDILLNRLRSEYPHSFSDSEAALGINYDTTPALFHKKSGKVLNNQAIEIVYQELVKDNPELSRREIQYKLSKHYRIITEKGLVGGLNYVKE